MNIFIITFTTISAVLGVLILVLFDMYAERHKELSDMVIKHIKKAWIALGIRILYTFVGACHH